MEHQGVQSHFKNFGLHPPANVKLSAGIILAAVVNNVKASVTQCTLQFIPDSHIRLMQYFRGEGSFSSGGESIVYCLSLPADSRGKGKVEKAGVS